MRVCNFEHDHHGRMGERTDKASYRFCFLACPQLKKSICFFYFRKMSFHKREKFIDKSKAGYTANGEWAVAVFQVSRGSMRQGRGSKRQGIGCYAVGQKQ